MRYIDAGYAAALGALFVYTVSLFYRRSRLQKIAVRVTERRGKETDGSRHGR